MLSHDDITQQRELLAAHRKTLAVLLTQQAMHGDPYAPPSVLTGIDNARAAILRIKATLRAAGVAVDDGPDDDPAPAAPSLTTLAPPPTPVQQTISAEDGSTISNVTQHSIHTSGGDYVGGDKIEGDKVGRDKVIYNQSDLSWNQALRLLVVLLIVGTIIITVANLSWVKGALQDIGILPLPFAAEQPGENLIVVVPFFRTDQIADYDIAHLIAERIRAALPPNRVEHVRVEVADGVQVRAEDRAKAAALGQRYHASMIIWGSDVGVQVTVNYLNLRQPDFKAAAANLQETGTTGRTQVANPQAFAGFVTHDLPGAMTFLTLFAVGQSAYSRADYPAATRIISGALDALDGVTPLPQGTADAYFRLGWLYQVPGQDSSHAEAAYTQALALDPKNTAAYTNRGVVYGEQGALDQALADFNQALALDPKLAFAYNNRGNVYYDKGALDPALADFNQALALDPQYANAYVGRGNVYDDQGALDRALADFNQALALDPKDALPYYNRGVLYAKQGALDRALADFNQALALDPKLAAAYIGRGVVYYTQGALNQALADYNQAVALDPKFAPAYYNRGLLHQDRGEHEAAVADFRQARDLSQNPQVDQAADDRLKELGAP